MWYAAENCSLKEDVRVLRALESVQHAQEGMSQSTAELEQAFQEALKSEEGTEEAVGEGRFLSGTGRLNNNNGNNTFPLFHFFLLNSSTYLLNPGYHGDSVFCFYGEVEGPVVTEAVRAHCHNAGFR